MSLLEIIFKYKDQDATPRDIAPDGLACAETVSTILREYLAQKGIIFPVIISTYELWKELEKREDLFERVYEPQSEDIVISPTKLNTRPDLMPHGHAGFYIDSDRIASNDSRTGQLKINYDRESWRQTFHYYGGYPVKLYRLRS